MTRNAGPEKGFFPTFVARRSGSLPNRQAAVNLPLSLLGKSLRLLFSRHSSHLRRQRRGDRGFATDEFTFATYSRRTGPPVAPTVSSYLRLGRRGQRSDCRHVWSAKRRGQRRHTHHLPGSRPFRRIIDRHLPS
ncbi:hypothetical protein CHELA20_52478 [Hyphomicrobiales bacterium]|nr:hypothetical protein CHELA41_22445 [Hyphomicrobiales bacterium]CAH1681993.1 hypothetical protein CHELA20_52478 [Hyphomicrobiales bacterium]